MKKIIFILIVVVFLLISCTNNVSDDTNKEGDGMSDSNIAVLETSMGPIKVRLDPENAPVTTENFKKYVNDDFYDGLIFHRVIPGFMIQGGGFYPSGEKKATRVPIELEADNGLSNDRGTIAMARTSIPDSATSQFFINLVDNSALDYPNNGGYAVFGEVIEGMDVVDSIAGVETASKAGHNNWPVEDVVIEKAYME